MPKMFTRTTPVTTATVVVLDMETLTGIEESVQLAGYFKTSEDLLKVLKSRDTEDKKYTAVKAMDTEEKLFGMSDDTFMKYAEELDPKTRKPIPKATPSVSSEVETTDGTWSDNSETVPSSKKSK